MKLLTAVIITLFIFGCASEERRKKLSDPVFDFDDCTNQCMALNATGAEMDPRNNDCYCHYVRN